MAEVWRKRPFRLSQVPVVRQNYITPWNQQHGLISSVLNLLQIRHDALHPTFARSHRSPFSRSKNFAAGEPGSQATGLGAEAKESATQADQLDRCFWIVVSRIWSDWKNSLLLVKPETVVEWHRRGFRLYWRLKSKAGPAGRSPISPELQQLIFRVARENPTWGAPRIHGELLMLGFDVAERTISRWVRRYPRKPDPSQRWLAFLRNHR